MRACKLTLCLLPALAFGCAQFRRAGTPGSDVLVSFPDHLRQGDQVVGFELHIRNGTILAVDTVPRDWVIRLLAEWPGSEMGGEPNHGASAFQDMIPLKRFVIVHKEHDPFELMGSVVVTTDFITKRTNLVPKQAHWGRAIVHIGIFQILAAKISSLVISTCSIHCRFNPAWRFSVAMRVSSHFLVLRKDTSSVVAYL